MEQQLSLPKQPLRFLIFVTRPYAVWAVLACASVVLASALDVFTNFAIKELIDSATGFSEGVVGMAAVTLWAALYPIGAVGHSLAYRLSSFFGMRWVTGLTMHTRDVLLAHLLNHSHTYFGSRFAGAVNSKVWNASDGVATLAENTMWSFLNVIIFFIGSLYLMGEAHPLLALIFAAGTVILVSVSFIMVQKNEKLSYRRSKERSKLTGLFVDILTNMVAVRSYDALRNEWLRASEKNREYRTTALAVWQASEIALVINNLIMGVFVVCILAVSFSLWQSTEITLGEFVMMLSLMAGVTGWFSQIGANMNRTAEQYGNIREGLSEILVPHDIADRPEATPFTVTRGTITFDHVTFSYGAQQVFDSLTLVIEPGQRVGIVGPSGGGKSTFVSLLLREQEVDSGSITIDGTALRQMTLASLRNAVAVVPQEPLLFHRTIRENIAYGKPEATDEEVREAARKAQAHDFILSLEKGYDTLVGERGVKLSGGQRQRIAIARAILKAAPILVLDEATSSLDSESEVEIQKALHELMKGKTVIAIAHRLSTIKEMDRILVLENGTVIEDGSHEVLLKKNGTYARLWNHQAGGFLPDA